MSLLVGQNERFANLLGLIEFKANQVLIVVRAAMLNNSGFENLVAQTFALAEPVHLVSDQVLDGVVIDKSALGAERGELFRGPGGSCRSASWRLSPSAAVAVAAQLRGQTVGVDQDVVRHHGMLKRACVVHIPQVGLAERADVVTFLGPQTHCAVRRGAYHSMVLCRVFQPCHRLRVSAPSRIHYTMGPCSQFSFRFSWKHFV